MKFAYLVPILALSAALGASSKSPNRGHAGLAGAPAAAVTPPWLTGEWDGAELAEEAEDPHAGLYAAAEGDPHAGLYAEDGTPLPPAGPSGACTYEPEADAPAACASCGAGGGDPHAGLYPAEGDDPHAGLHATGDADPHALGRAAAAAPVTAPAAPLERSHAPNGKTVAEVFAARAALDQQKIRVRGTVVKLTEGVLGKTYLHLRDGTGNAAQGDDDLTVTTTQAFSLGETVEVEGQLAIDQDIGVGYSYPALLADALRVPG